MKEKFNNFIDKLNYLIIVVLAILLPVTFFINYFSIYHFHWGFTFKIHQYLTFILPIEIFIYFYKLFTRRFKIGISDVLIYLLILFGILSTINALDVKLAIWGSVYRYEGLVQIVTYYMLFLNSRFINNKEKIVKLINWFISIGLIQFVYSLLQVFVRGKYIYVKFDMVYFRSSGFVGHPNMLGSYIVLVLLLSLGMYFLYDKNRKFYLISSICLYINLILAESTGPYYGFILTYIFMLIFLKVKNNGICLKKTLISLGVGIFLLIGVSYGSISLCKKMFNDEYIDKATIVGDIKITLDTIGRIITSSDEVDKQGVSIKEHYASNRIWIWKTSLKLVPEYWLTGTGIDNFGIAFKKINQTYKSYYDRAHNEYLHLLITQGVFACVYYLSLLLLLFVRGIKSKDKLVWILLFAFVGYVLQAFTNISVYNVAPFFFVVMGFMEGLIIKEKNTNLLEVD